MANFVGKLGVAQGDIVPESFIFAKDNHHLQTFPHELEKVDNPQIFSFADYSRYTVCFTCLHLQIDHDSAFVLREHSEC